MCCFFNVPLSELGMKLPMTPAGASHNYVFRAACKAPLAVRSDANLPNLPVCLRHAPLGAIWIASSPALGSRARCEHCCELAYPAAERRLDSSSEEQDENADHWWSTPLRPEPKKAKHTPDFAFQCAPCGHTVLYVARGLEVGSGASSKCLLEVS